MASTDSHMDFDTHTTEDWQSLIESLSNPINEQDISATLLDVKDTTASGEDWWNCGILEDASIFPDDLSLNCLSPPTEASTQMETIQTKLANLEAIINRQQEQIQRHKAFIADIQEWSRDANNALNQLSRVAVISPGPESVKASTLRQCERCGHDIIL